MTHPHSANTATAGGVDVFDLYILTHGLVTLAM